MKYNTKSIKFFSNGSSYFCNSYNIKYSVFSINQLDFIKYNDSENLSFKDLTESNKYLNVLRKYNLKKPPFNAS